MDADERPDDRSDESFPIPGSQDASDRKENRGWRLASIVGLVLASAIAAIHSFPLAPRQGRLVAMAIVIVICATLTLRFLFSTSWRRLLKNADLLVPIGVVLGIEQLWGMLAQTAVLASIVQPEKAIQVWSLTLGLSVSTIVHIAIWTSFAAWQTDLLLRAASDASSVSLSPWQSIKQYFLRTLAVLTVGVGVLMIALIPILAIGAVNVYLAMPLLFGLAITWNLATTCLLPVTLLNRKTLPQALMDGVQVSWKRKNITWTRLLTHLLLLGFVIFLSVRYTETASEYGPFPNQGTTTSRTNHSYQWQVNAFWVGGYAHECRWSSKYSKGLNVDPVPLVNLVLDLVFLVVAVAMKSWVIRPLIASDDTTVQACGNGLDA